MLTPFGYYALLLLISGYAFIYGRRDERMVASICIVASLATSLVVSPLHARYAGMETGVMLVDLLALAGFTWVALKSDRFWPLWISGLQLTTSMSHFLKAINLDLLPHAYAAAARFWVYPILFILVVGTWRGHQRFKRSQSRLESGGAAV